MTWTNWTALPVMASQACLVASAGSLQTVGVGVGEDLHTSASTVGAIVRGWGRRIPLVAPAVVGSVGDSSQRQPSAAATSSVPTPSTALRSSSRSGPESTWTDDVWGVTTQTSPTPRSK